jgi:hypothetical protein
MNTKDASPALKVGEVDGNLPVESSRTEQSLIEDVHSVRRGDGNNAGVAIEAIHLNKDLVDCLLALVVTTRKASTSLPSYSVNLIDKDDARRVLFRLGEDVTDTTSTDTDEHLHKFGT